MNEAITAAARAYIAAETERQHARQRVADAEQALVEAAGVQEDDDTRAVAAEGWVFIFRFGCLNEAMPIEGVAP